MTARLAFAIAVAAGSASPAPAGPAIIAYVFPKDGLIDPSEIAADKLTHVNYAFANIVDGRVVEGSARDAENYQVLTALRRRHPHLRILVSVGGWTWSGGFSDAALTPESRRRFVESAVEFVRRHDLDGFDVDWEYPGLPGYGNTHRPEDKQNFTALMSELRAALDVESRARGRRYLLTFAAGASAEFLEHTEMDKVQASVDFVNLMTYDFRVAEADPETGHHANLYANPMDPRQVSADGAVRAFLAAGVPPAKLVLGVPFYGRAWGEVNADKDGLYQSGKPVAERIDTSHANLSAHLVDRDGYVRRWDRDAQAPFLWNAEKRIFITYDDPESLKAKSRYIREHGLGGAMFWEYYADRPGALLGTLFAELRAKGEIPMASQTAGAGDVFVSRRAASDFALSADPRAEPWKGVTGVFADKDRQGQVVSSHRTEIRSRWTEKNLYLLFICPYEELYLKPDPSTRTETARLWEWDVAEAFIGSDFENVKRYKEFQVSPQSEWIDLAIDLGAQPPAYDASWSSEFAVKARIDRDRRVWYGEMRIPIAAIDARPPQPGRELRINLYRIQGPPQRRTWINWQPVNQQSFHTPEAFGRLRLEP